MLSYSHLDERVVKVLVQGLESAKREVWFDSDVTGGDAWWDSILANIRSASVVLFAVSDAALRSKPCQLELEYAIALARQVLPIQVGPIENLRASPLAALQIIGYDPGSAQSGFTVLAAIDEAAQRIRPLPDPLPPAPPIPYEYLRVLGRQIETTELSVAEQDGVVDQLRRALGQETDESVRQNILSMLRNLGSKPWTTRRTELDVRALLIAHSAVVFPVEKPAEQPTGPVPDPASDPRGWFSARLDEVLAQRAAGRPAAGSWRPPTDAREQWSRTFVPSPQADPVAPAADGPDATPPPSYFAGTPAEATQPPDPEPATPWRPAPAPAATAPAAATDPAPPAYRALSILALLSVVFGVVALCYSVQVGRRHGAGDIDGARRASARAKVFGIVGVAVAVLVGVYLLTGL